MTKNAHFLLTRELAFTDTILLIHTMSEQNEIITVDLSQNIRTLHFYCTELGLHSSKIHYNL